MLIVPIDYFYKVWKVPGNMVEDPTDRNGEYCRRKRTGVRWTYGSAFRTLVVGPVSGMGGVTCEWVLSGGCVCYCGSCERNSFLLWR